MTPNKRRSEIINTLILRRRDNVKNLAFEFDVSERTIKSDIEMLTIDYPLETIRGNGGCVKIADDYRSYNYQLPQKHEKALINLLDKTEEVEYKAVCEILAAFGSPTVKKLYS